MYFLTAKEFMHTGNVENPDVSAVSGLIETSFRKEELEARQIVRLFITQGFVCLDETGEISTLKTGRKRL